MTMPDTPKESTERDLESLSADWQDLGSETPPDLVDMAVLNRAKAAAEKPQRHWFWNMSWVHGVTTVAVAAIAMTLFLQMPDEEMPGSPATEVFSAPQPPAPMAADAPAPAASLEETSAVPRRDRPAMKASQSAPMRSENEARENKTEVYGATRAQPAAEMQRQAVTGQMEDAEPLLDREMDALSTATDLDKRSVELEPEAWLEQLKDLKANGDTEAFDKGLEAFRMAYPDYPVPEDLLE